jgi:hypothetical protein
MKNEMKNTIARSKTHICLEDEEKTKAEWNDEEDGFESFIEFRPRIKQIMQKLYSSIQNTESVVLYSSEVAKL